MQHIAIKDLPLECLLDAESRMLTGTIYVPDNSLDLLKSNIRIKAHGDSRSSPDKSNFKIVLNSIPKLGLALGALEGRIEFGARCSGNYNMNLFGECDIRFGPSCTCNGLNIMGMGGELKVGEDCMFADGINIYLGDNHGVIDTTTGNLYASEKNITTIGEHVWVGAGVRIMKNASIGKGSIIAASSVVTAKPFPPCCLIGGNPANVKKINTSWTRSTTGRNWNEVSQKFNLV